MSLTESAGPSKSINDGDDKPMSFFESSKSSTILRRVLNSADGGLLFQLAELKGRGKNNRQIFATNHIRANRMRSRPSFFPILLISGFPWLLDRQ